MADSATAKDFLVVRRADLSGCKPNLHRFIPRATEVVGWEPLIRPGGLLTSNCLIRLFLPGRASEIGPGFRCRCIRATGCLALLSFFVTPGARRALAKTRTHA